MSGLIVGRLLPTIYPFGTTGLFGLRRQQMRGQMHELNNCGWYNAVGQFIGCGDLNATDLVRIANELQGWEALFLIAESDWHERPREQEYNAPDEAWLFQMARYVVTLGAIWLVTSTTQMYSSKMLMVDVAMVNVITPKDLADLCGVKLNL